MSLTLNKIRSLVSRKRKHRNTTTSSIWIDGQLVGLSSAFTIGAKQVEMKPFEVIVTIWVEH